MANVSGSANVSIREIDLTTRVPSFPGVYGAIAIPAKKGPISEPTLVTGDSQFLKRYTPNEKIDVGMDNAHFSGLNYLQQSNRLWVNRVANSALYAIMLYASSRSTVSTLNLKDDVVANATNDTLEVTASFSNYLNTGDIVTFSKDAGATLPQGLSIETNYYVIKKDSGLIQVSNTYAEATNPIKAITVDYTTDVITVGNSFTFTTNYSSTTPERMTIQGHGLVSGDKVRLTSAGTLPTPTAPKTATVVASSGQVNITCTGHGLVDNQQVRVQSTGTLSVGLDSTIFYYVKVVNANTINLTLTPSGSSVVYDGTLSAGTFTVHPEIFYAVVINSNTITIEPVVGNSGGVVVFTNDGTGVHTLTKPHGLANGTPLQFVTQGTTKKFTTVYASSDKVFTCEAHGLTNGTVVLLTNDRNTPDLPNGLTQTSVRYYVINATTNTFELETTLGSNTAITFSDDGTGNHFFNTGITPNAASPTVEGTTYYIVSAGFNTFKIATTIGGAVINLTDNGSGSLFIHYGFIDLVTAGTVTSTDFNYVNRGAYSRGVSNTTFTTNYVSNNRLTLSDTVVSSMETGMPVRFTSAGVLPSPLQADKTYYVIKYPIIAPETQLQSYHTNSTTIKLAISLDNALVYTPTNDTSLVLTTNGTGTHKVYYTRGLSETVNGFELGSIIENFAINQDSLNEQIIVPETFGERIDTGDAVIFKTNLNGRLPLPLLANTSYYVIKGTDANDATYNTHFKLATTKANALAGTPFIDLTDNITVTQSSAVSAQTDIITVPSSFGSMIAKGTPVTVSSSATLPRPLKANVVYYTIPVSDTTLKLALSPNDAVLDIAVDLTDVGSGNMIITLDGENTITFTPSVADPTAFTFGTDDALLFYSANEGAWGNDVHVRLEDYRHKEADAFLVKVFKKTNLNIEVEKFVCSRKAKKDGHGRNIYIVDVLEASNYIRCFDNTLIDDDVFPVMSVATASNPNARSLTNGHDGSAVTEGMMILGAEMFANAERLPVTVLMDGGWAFPSYQRALDAIAQARQDCVAILSTPFDKEANSDYLNALVDYRNLDLNLNSSYSAIYSPSPLIYDKFNDRRVYISPDGFVGALISATAANYEMWFPVAGFRRGLINVLDLRRRFTKGEMDFLYDSGINPIRFAPGRGILVWGQKTLLARPSALDRLNVRLLLIVIEPAIKEALEDFLFELNDLPTRSLAKTLIESYLEGIKARRGITDFKVIIDDSNNSADDLDNHIMNVWVFIKPTPSLEYIPVSVIVTPTGLSFSLAESLVT